MVSAARSHVTAAAFLASPDNFPPHSQLVEGTVVVNEPNLVHQRVRDHILVALVNWCRSAHGRGEALSPLDTPIDDRNVFAPDVLWFSEEHRPARGATRLDRLPDLAVEVRSPSTWRFDIGPKRRLYERAGLPELWLVDTVSRCVRVHRRSTTDQIAFDVALEANEADVLVTPLLPGFELDVGELFDR